MEVNGAPAAAGVAMSLVAASGVAIAAISAAGVASVLISIACTISNVTPGASLAMPISWSCVPLLVTSQICGPATVVSGMPMKWNSVSDTVAFAVGATRAAGVAEAATVIGSTMPLAACGMPSSSGMRHIAT